MAIEIFQDALFSAIAAIGFACASNPPRRAYLYCGLIAAAGHSTRYLLLHAGSNSSGFFILATAVAALLIGIFSVAAAPIAKVPAETYLYPALLPMIPGMYAYRMFGSLAILLSDSGEECFYHNFYLFVSQGLMFFTLLLVMAVGATAPMFLFKRISFQATRRNLQ